MTILHIDFPCFIDHPPFSWCLCRFRSASFGKQVSYLWLSLQLNIVCHTTGTCHSMSVLNLSAGHLRICFNLQKYAFHIAAVRQDTYWMWPTLQALSEQEKEADSASSIWDWFPGLAFSNAVQNCRVAEVRHSMCLVQFVSPREFKKYNAYHQNNSRWVVFSWQIS